MLGASTSVDDPERTPRLAGLSPHGKSRPDGRRKPWYRKGSPTFSSLTASDEMILATPDG
jgi:hypothetical protein